jgi:hypothetical protein
MGCGSSDFGGDFRREAAPAPVETAAQDQEPSYGVAGYNAYKKSDYVLKISAGYIEYYYDFKARILTAKTDKTHILPFSQVDRDALVEARAELVKQGGKPPELPAETTVLDKSPPSLRL